MSRTLKAIRQSVSGSTKTINFLHVTIIQTKIMFNGGITTEKLHYSVIIMFNGGITTEKLHYSVMFSRYSAREEQLHSSGN